MDLSFESCQGVKKISLHKSGQSQSIPTSQGERAVEKQMLEGFISVEMAKHAAVAV